MCLVGRVEVANSTSASKGEIRYDRLTGELERFRTYYVGGQLEVMKITAGFSMIYNRTLFLLKININRVILQKLGFRWTKKNWY